MADIELVIKIPEEVKNRFCFGITYQKDIQTVCEALNNGTPIPDNATVCDIDQIRDEIEEGLTDYIIGERDTPTAKKMFKVMNKALEIIDKHMKEAEHG